MSKGQESLLVPFAMFGLIPLAWALMLRMRPHKALVATFICAHLFLPIFSYLIVGSTAYDRATAPGLAVLSGMLLRDRRRLADFSWRWIDVPMIVWCFCPLLTVISLGREGRELVGSIVKQSLRYGLPYFLGRVYLRDWAALKDLAVGMVAGALAYAPLCLWEIRMSPHLHADVYGYAQHSFVQTIRQIGYRPMVFMQHGLAVGMYMCMGALTAYWLWQSKSIQRIAGIPVPLIALGLIAVGVACQSYLAIVFLFGGIALLSLTLMMRNSAMVACLLIAPVLYIGARSANLWSAQELVEVAGNFGQDREGSIRSRVQSEDILIRYSLKKPWFGYDNPEMGADDQAAIWDAYWVINLNKFGLLGLSAWVLAQLLGPAVLLRRIPIPYWRHPLIAPGIVLCLVQIFSLCDNLFNAMHNPVFILLAGGVASLAVETTARLRPAEAPAPT